MITLDIRKKVTQCFEFAIQNHFKDKPELMRFALFHERRPLVINHLCREIYKVEMKHGRKNVESAVNNLIYSVAIMFAEAAKSQKDAQNMSELAKTFVSNEQRIREEVASVLQEVPNASRTPDKV